MWKNGKSRTHFLCPKLNNVEKMKSIDNINSCNLRKNKEATYILRKNIKKREILYRKIKSKNLNETKKCFVKKISKTMY